MKKLFCCAFALAQMFAYAAAQDKSISVSINPQKTFQTIDNFTAADAWSGNFVGQYFDEPQRGQVAKWLFSQKLGVDGNPEGIGLSLWRVNVGGGSLEQDGADIGIFQRRAESFLTKDGKGYDWGKCSGQQYFMRKAKEYGCDDFLLFSNSPPVQYTRNGKGYGIKDEPDANLKEDCYGKFADFLAVVARHFADEGYNIKYVSPINEPQMTWQKSNNQEGSPWQAQQIARVFKELDRALGEKNLSSTKMVLGEAAALDYVYGGKSSKYWDKVPAQKRPFNMAERYFAKSGDCYVGDLKHMADFIGAHSYHSHTSNERLVDTRKKVAEACAKAGVKFQQTEWCLLPEYNQKNHSGFSADWFSDNRADIQSGLLLGRIIYADFTFANSEAWGYWKGMEVNGNYALIGIYPTDGDILHGGVVRSNKLLWALGNYSLFVRPQFKRIDISGADNLDGVVGTAFVSPDAKRVVAVFVNSAFENIDAKINLDGDWAKKIAKVSAFRTDSNMDLGNLHISSADNFKFPARSITTIVYDLK